MISTIRTHVFLLASIALTTGCYVEPGPPPPQGQAEVVVQGEPPPPPAAQVEVVPAPPSPEHFWVAGYHRWWGGRYIWVAGRYERRPHPAATWEGAHWEARGGGRVFVEGRWR